MQTLEYISEEMPPETPLAFGLHPNAAIGFRRREAAGFCSSMAALLPQFSGITSDLTLEDRVSSRKILI